MIRRALGFISLLLLSVLVGCTGVTSGSKSTVQSAGSAALTISTSTLPNGTLNSSYTASLSAVGGSSPYTWSVASGQLPAGIALGAGGALSGTPTGSGQFSFNVQVSDSSTPQQKATIGLSLAVSSVAGALSITTSGLPAGSLGSPYVASLNASGGSSPYVWGVTSGSLPSGISLSASGQLSGTPTASGAYNLILQATDHSGQAASQTFILNVTSTPPIGLTASAATAGFSSGSQILHAPFFAVSSWTGELPSIVMVGSAVKVLNTDYFATKSDSSSLLLAFVSDIPANTTIQVYNSAGSGPGPLTGMTPNNFTAPSGWTFAASENFESGCAGAGTNTGCVEGGPQQHTNLAGMGAPAGWNFTTFHPDGNASHTHAFMETISNGASDQPSEYFGINQLGIGTRSEMLWTWYEYYEPTWRWNCETFETRVHTDPFTQESILDAFANSGDQRNTTDFTILNNIQGNYDEIQPFIPSNIYSAVHNWSPLRGQWNQWTMHYKWNTVTTNSALGATVTLNASAGVGGSLPTLTINSGTFPAGWCVVGADIKFAGFANSVNNTYGWTIATCTPTVITMANSTGYPAGAPTSAGRGAGFMISESNVSGVSSIRSNLDGQYELYLNGIPVASSTGMNLPGAGANAFKQTEALVLEFWGNTTTANDSNGSKPGSCPGGSITPNSHRYIDDILFFYKP